MVCNCEIRSRAKGGKETDQDGWPGLQTRPTECVLKEISALNPNKRDVVGTGWGKRTKRQQRWEIRDREDDSRHFH